MQARYKKIDGLGNISARNSYPSHNSRTTTSYVTPALHSTSPSRIPETSRARSCSPYNVFHDLGAVSAQHCTSTWRTVGRFSSQTSHGGSAAVASEMLPSDHNKKTSHASHYMHPIAETSARSPVYTALQAIGPQPFQSARVEASTPQFGTHESRRSRLVPVQPGTGQPKGKKRRAHRSPSGSDAGDDTGASSRSDEERRVNALAALKEREKERYLIAWLRELLFGETTTYTTRSNGVKQADITHKKLEVLQGAIDKINQLQKQVNYLNTLVNEYQQIFAAEDQSINSLLNH